MIETIVDLDDDKVGASKTTINVKSQEDIKGRVKFRDIHGTQTNSSQFIYYFVTVQTLNHYKTSAMPKMLLSKMSNILCIIHILIHILTHKKHSKLMIQSFKKP